MSQRINYMQVSADLFKKYYEFSAAVKNGSIEQVIQDLIAIRASQINGCGFCVDMHIKQAKIHGERELRIHHLTIWRESPLFSEREKAALAWTEALTTLGAQGVPDAVYEQVRAQFDERALTELTYAVMVINGWNRLNVAFRPVPGSSDVPFGLSKAY